MTQTPRQRAQELLLGLLEGDGPDAAVVVVTGSQGVGKTRLIQDVVFGASQPRSVVWAQRGRLEQASGQLRDQAGTGRVALVVDDAHLLDAAGCAWLDDVLTHHAHDPLLVVVAGRSPALDRAPVLAALDRRQEATVEAVVEVEPLSDQELGRILRELGLGPGPDLDAAVRIAAGNPAVAHELAGAAPAPPDLLVERLWAADLAGMLSVLALIGRPVCASLLARACGTDPCRLARALSEGREAGLVRVDERTGRHELTLPVLGDVVRAHLTPDRIREVHLAIANALDHVVDPNGEHRAERARHLVAAAVGGDLTAQACLEAGLWEEAHGGFSDAEELATYGLDTDHADAAVRSQLQRLLGRCHGRAGRIDAARDAFERVIQLDRAELTPADVAECVGDLIHVDLSLTSPAANRAVLITEALDGAGDRVDLRAGLLAAQAAGLYYLDLERSRELAVQALALAASGSDDRAKALVQDVFALGSVASRESVHVEVLARQWRQGAPQAAPGPLPVELGPALLRGDRAATDYVLARQARWPVRLQSERERGLLDAARLSRAVVDGDAELVRSLTPALRAHACADVTALAVVAELVWSLHTGERLGPTALEVSTLLTLPMARLFLTGTAVVGAFHGDAAARESLGLLAQDQAALHEPRQDLSYDASCAVLAILAGLTDDQELCRLAVDRLDQMSDRFITLGMVVTIGPVGWFKAWAHAGLGNLPAALEANAQARQASQDFGAGPWTVQCLLQGAALLREPEPKLAANLARAAADQAEQLGLTELAARGRHLAQSEPAAAVASLRHQQILELAAQGLTNDEIARRLFLSVSTVERHFTHVYRALGVRNRAEAVAAAAALASRSAAIEAPDGAEQG